MKGNPDSQPRRGCPTKLLPFSSSQCLLFCRFISRPAASLPNVPSWSHNHILGHDLTGTNSPISSYRFAPKTYAGLVHVTSWLEVNLFVSHFQRANVHDG
jgi:hypothetical protein